MPRVEDSFGFRSSDVRHAVISPPSIRSRAAPKRHQSSRSRRYRARQIRCFKFAVRRTDQLLAPSTWQRASRVWQSNLSCACSSPGLLAASTSAFGAVRPPSARCSTVWPPSLSDPGFLVIDRFAMGCYLGILTVLVLVRWLPVFTGRRFRCTRPQRSSLALRCTRSREPAKPIRGDEWAYHTPAILHQVYRSTPFDSGATPLGPDHASLFSNLPVRHFTTIFRPQFWGFFILAAGLRLFVLLAVQGPAAVDWRVFAAPAPDAVEPGLGIRSALVRLFTEHSVDVFVAVAAARDGRPVLPCDVRRVLHVRRTAAGDARRCGGRSAPSAP